MRAPSPPELLSAWEAGAGQSPADRALTLLRLVMPQESDESRAALSLGQRERWLLSLRKAAFGPRLSALVTCAACGHVMEFDFAVDDLPTDTNAEDCVMVELDGFKVRARQPNGEDMRAVAAARAEDAESILLRRCVIQAEREGQSIDGVQLPGSVLAEIERRLAEADGLVDLRLDAPCAHCGAESSTAFDVGEFLWAELDAYASRLLSEVHELASAYGWAENDILSMSATRRRIYLEWVRA
jgi:hypothetical protein